MRRTSAEEELRDCFPAVRQASEHLSGPLAVEDYVAQSMPDASPIKWHLAHTTWFFETFALERDGYQAFDPAYRYLFNSYYDTVGQRHPRPQRGLLTRPSVEDVFQYRRHVDQHVDHQLQNSISGELANVLEIGLHHEQQHQELMLTDLKHLFWCNPLRPAYTAASETEPAADNVVAPHSWVSYDKGLQSLGYDGAGFCYDNEKPRHDAYVDAFQLASRLVTNGEFIEFINDGGYRRPDLWLADGWDTVANKKWKGPHYWEERDEQFSEFTLSGMRAVRMSEPVCHVSFYEADAFARWAGARLPTEAEWETAARDVPREGNFVENGIRHPRRIPPQTNGKPVQMYGDVWEWTASPYVAYPGYTPPAGALGEYNGKFMCNQFVLRGGSCATPRSHIRATYRNFFKPDARWQFSGIRLARSAAR